MVKKCWVFILMFVLLGCAAEKVKTIPNQRIAIDIKNDKVANVTPEIEKILLRLYLEDSKVPRSKNDYKRVLNSVQVDGGIVYLARVKNGFFYAYVEKGTNPKAYYLSGEEHLSGEEPGYIGGVSSTQLPGELEKYQLLSGVFNPPDAETVVIKWGNSTTETYKLVNGTFMMFSKEFKGAPTQWQLYDTSGKAIKNVPHN